MPDAIPVATGGEAAFRDRESLFRERRIAEARIAAARAQGLDTETLAGRRWMCTMLRGDFAAARAISDDVLRRGRGRSEASDDILETAALLTHLDLIVTVDIMVAHLAGALARPVWTLLHFGADWRWLLDRADSPWYPIMRLFLQPSPGAWGPVVGRVTEKRSQLGRNGARREQHTSIMRVQDDVATP